MSKEQNKEKWKRFEEKVKAKREINSKKTSCRISAKSKAATQRPCSTKTERCVKKSTKIYLYRTRGIRPISSLSHFGRRVDGTECDILAGEQGPSCSTLDQTPDLNKVIHVRFLSSDTNIVSIPDEKESENDDSFPIPKKKCGPFGSFAKPKSLTTPCELVKDEKLLKHVQKSFRFQVS